MPSFALASFGYSKAPAISEKKSPGGFGFSSASPSKSDYYAGPDYFFSSNFYGYFYKGCCYCVPPKLKSNVGEAALFDYEPEVMDPVKSKFWAG